MIAARKMARKVASPPHLCRKLVKPDFAKRRKAIWGSRVFSAAEVKAMRDLLTFDANQAALAKAEGLAVRP